MDVIPPRFRPLLKNVVFVVEAEPRRPGLLGLYEGRPLTERSVSEPARMPDRIVIYQGPHERLARDREDLRRLVRETIWHEVAHHFGISDPRLRELGCPIKLDGATPRYRPGAPLGADTEAVLAEIGVDAAELAALRARGAV